MQFALGEAELEDEKLVEIVVLATNQFIRLEYIPGCAAYVDVVVVVVSVVVVLRECDVSKRPACLFVNMCILRG